MPGHTGGHQKSGYGPTGSAQAKGPQGSSKGSTKGGQNKKSFSEKLKEKRKQNEINIHNAKAIKDGTAVTNVNPNTGKVSYVMNQGKIVTYSGGAAKAKKDAEKRAAELAQKELAQKGITASLDMARQMMQAERQTLLDRAKQSNVWCKSNHWYGFW
jgi:hypothetical protein